MELSAGPSVHQIKGIEKPHLVITTRKDKRMMSFVQKRNKKCIFQVEENSFDIELKSEALTK